jgi:two-component system response regulator AtoC
VRDIKVDVRVVAATNRALDVLVKEGRFREDLYYRLNVIPISIPPLRERRDDILPLARHFLADADRTFHKSIKAFAQETERLLQAYSWPGNVRELKNLIERLVILGTGDLIEPFQLPGQFLGRSDTPSTVASAPAGSGPLRTLAAIEKEYIVRVLEQVKGNKSEAAKVLGITRQTLRKKLAEDPDA